MSVRRGVDRPLFPSSLLRRRAGMLFTLVTLILVMVAGIVFFSANRPDPAAAHRGVETRVRSMETFIHDLRADAERAAYIAGFRSLIAMEQDITNTGTPITDPATAFREVFMTGNISGASYTIMANSSFGEYLSRIEETAASQGIIMNASVTNVTLWQASPWYVLVNFTFHADIEDARGMASWDYDDVFTGRIPVVDLRDPLYTARTFGRIQRVIKMPNGTAFVNDSGNRNDTTVLLRHFNQSLYHAAGRGPDILMRFAGNISDSPFGIETLADVEELQAQGLSFNYTNSVVDYLLFNNTPATVCNIQELPTTLRFDATSAAIYNVTGALEDGGCP